MHRKLTLAMVAAVTLILIGGTGCVSFGSGQKRSTFLQTADPTWNQWLEEKIDLDVTSLPLWRLHQVAAFQGIRYRLEGQTAGGVMVTLKVENQSRRDVLWAIHKETGLLIDFKYAKGLKMLRFRSKKMAELTGGG